MDTWAAASARIPRQMKLMLDFPKPMAEQQYDAMAPGKTRNVDQFDTLRKYGFWSLMIPLTEIYAGVVALNDQSVHHPAFHFARIEQVRNVEQQLDHWLEQLPSHLHNTPENVRHHANGGVGRNFIWLHAAYHHHSQLLYYQFLRPSSEPRTDSNVEEDYFASRCKAHAVALSQLLWTANTTAGLECLWINIGHLLVITSCVHLHTLLLDHNEFRLAQAKQLLERNFIMLLQLQKYWPSLSLSMSRLRAFHQSCRTSTEATFDMDNWMLHFLQEYASPVTDRLTQYDRDACTSPLCLMDSPNPLLPFHQEVQEGTAMQQRGAAMLQTFL